MAAVFTDLLHQGHRFAPVLLERLLARHNQGLVGGLEHLVRPVVSHQAGPLGLTNGGRGRGGGCGCGELFVDGIVVGLQHHQPLEVDRILTPHQS